MFRFLSFSGPLQWIFIVSVLFIIRLPMLFDNWPLLIEDAQHMVLGERLASGAMLYRDVMDTTPPIPAFMYKWIHIFFGRSQKAYFFISMVLVLIQSILFKHFCHANNLLKEKGELPTFIYVILSCMMYDFYSLSPALIALTFILIAFDRIFRHLRSENAENDIFSTGFYIGMAYLCYEPSILFLGMAYYAFILYTRTNIRYYTIMLSGFIFPVLMSMLIYLFRGGLGGFLEYYIGYIPPKNLFLFEFNIIDALCIVSPGIILLFFGILKTFSYSRFVNYQIISNQIIFIWMLFFFVIILFFFSKTTSAYIFILPFAAYFTTHLFTLVNRRIVKTVLLIVYLINMWLIIHSIYTFSPYPSQVLNFNKQIMTSNNNFLEPKNNKILVIGEDYSLYAEGKLSGSFLQWSSVRGKIGDLTSYEQIKTVYEEFTTFPPDVVFDKENVFEKWSRYIPMLSENYMQLEKGLYISKNSQPKIKMK